MCYRLVFKKKCNDLDGRVPNKYLTKFKQSRPLYLKISLYSYQLICDFFEENPWIILVDMSETKGGGLIMPICDTIWHEVDYSKGKT